MSRTWKNIKGKNLTVASVSLPAYRITDTIVLICEQQR